MRKVQSTNSLNFQELVVLCPISYTISIMNGRWKPLIIDRLLRQNMRYGELRQSIPIITERVLTMQLKEMEQDGLISKIVHKQVPPKIVEYFLTEKGKSLKAVLMELYAWGHANRDTTPEISSLTSVAM